jgi:hypothetical protein
MGRGKGERQKGRGEVWERYVDEKGRGRER